MNSQPDPYTVLEETPTPFPSSVNLVVHDSGLYKVLIKKNVRDPFYILSVLDPLPTFLYSIMKTPVSTFFNNVVAPKPESIYIVMGYIPFQVLFILLL